MAASGLRGAMTIYITDSFGIFMFAKAVVREKRIPFDIATNDDLFFGPTNQARIKSAVTDLAAGNGLIPKTIAELEAMADES
jgi:DNA-damage-inducible protein J